MPIADTFHQTEPVSGAGDPNRPIVIVTERGEFYVSENFSIEATGPAGLYKIVDYNGVDRVFWFNVDRVIWIGPRS